MPATTEPLPFVYDDGGRAAAGYVGTAGDCTVRAIAIATGKPYQEVYDALFELSRRERLLRKRGQSPRDGVHKTTYKRYLQSIGWRFVPTMRIGSGCTTHLRAGELPMGRLVVSVSRHNVAVIDCVVHDTYDPSRDGTRCVYGYWIEPQFNATTKEFDIPGVRSLSAVVADVSRARSLSTALALANSDTSYT